MYNKVNSINTVKTINCQSDYISKDSPCQDVIFITRNLCQEYFTWQLRKISFRTLITMHAIVWWWRTVTLSCP